MCEINDIVGEAHRRVSFKNPMLDCVNIALFGSGMCEVFMVLRDDLLDAGYKVEVIDRNDMYSDAFKAGRRGDLIIIDEPGTARCTDELMTALTIDSAKCIDLPAECLPVKNSHHSNEPWRRKKWKNR